jgi:hypothetical protein
MIKTGVLFLLAATALGWQAGAVVARDLPKFDVNRTCRGEATDHTRTKAFVDACLADEQKAQEQLTKGWAQYAPDIQQTCVRTATDIAGIQSYVELLTCIEMGTAAKKMPQN